MNFCKNEIEGQNSKKHMRRYHSDTGLSITFDEKSFLSQRKG